MDKPNQTGKGPRKFISIYWSCCHRYSRIYKSKDGTQYSGYCPKCHSYLTVPVGEGGTNQRMFKTK